MAGPDIEKAERTAWSSKYDVKSFSYRSKQIPSWMMVESDRRWAEVNLPNDVPGPLWADFFGNMFGRFEEALQGSLDYLPQERLTMPLNREAWPIFELEASGSVWRIGAYIKTDCLGGWNLEQFTAHPYLLASGYTSRPEGESA